jgi:hypothetical protein
VNATNVVPVIATPLAYGIGFLLLIVVAFGEDWAGSLVTVAHEGAHYAFAVLAFRGPKPFKMDNGDNAGTPLTDDSWGVGDYILTFAGYATPPLLGLGGAVLITHGNAGGVLWIAVVLLLAAFLVAGNDLANAVTLLALIGVAWVAFAGSPTVQAAVAVGLVWWLLLGGLRAAVGMALTPTSDAGFLARRTLIPRIAWKGIWIFIAILCLLRGGRLLLFR